MPCASRSERASASSIPGTSLSAMTPTRRLVRPSGKVASSSSTVAANACMPAGLWAPSRRMACAMLLHELQAPGPARGGETGPDGRRRRRRRRRLRPGPRRRPVRRRRWPPGGDPGAAGGAGPAARARAAGPAGPWPAAAVAGNGSRDAPTSSARAAMTSRATPSAAVTTRFPGLMMAAFSVAIARWCRPGTPGGQGRRW